MSNGDDREEGKPGFWRNAAGSLLDWLQGRDSPDRIDSLIEGLTQVAQAVWFVSDETRRSASELIAEGHQIKRGRDHGSRLIYAPLETRWMSEAGALVSRRRLALDSVWFVLLSAGALMAWHWWSLQPTGVGDMIDVVVGGLTHNDAVPDFKRVFKNAFWVALAAAAIGSIALVFLLHVRQPWRIIAAMFLVTIPASAFVALGYDFAHRSNPVRVAEKNLTVQARTINAAKLEHERAAAELEGIKARRAELEAEIRARQLMLDNLQTPDKTLPTNRAALSAVQQLNESRVTQLKDDLVRLRQQRDEERTQLVDLKQKHLSATQRLRDLTSQASAAGTSNAPVPGFADLDSARAALAHEERQLMLDLEAALQRERLRHERLQSKQTELAARQVDQSLLNELASLIPDSPEQAQEENYKRGLSRIVALHKVLSTDLQKRKQDLEQLTKRDRVKTVLKDAEDAEKSAREKLRNVEQKTGKLEETLLDAQSTLFNSWGAGVGGGGVQAGDANPARAEPSKLYDKVAAIQQSVLQVTSVLASFVGANEFQVYMVVFAVVLLFPFLSKTVLGSTRGRRWTGLATVAAVLLLVLLA